MRSIEEMRDVEYFTNCYTIETFHMDFGVLNSTPWGLNHIADSILELNFRHNHITSIASMEGVKFVKLRSLFLAYNKITHLHSELLIAPRLRVLNLAGNAFLSLTDVTQNAWGSSLPEHDYLSISLRLNHWLCNGSLAWMQGRLFKLRDEIIYARPPYKPCVRFVERLYCHSPDARRGTTIVPAVVLQNVSTIIHALNGLTGNWSHDSHKT